MTYCREGKGLKAALGACFADLTAAETYGSCALSAQRFLYMDCWCLHRGALRLTDPFDICLCVLVLPLGFCW